MRSQATGQSQVFTSISCTTHIRTRSTGGGGGSVREQARKESDEGRSFNAPAATGLKHDKLSPAGLPQFRICAQ